MSVFYLFDVVMDSQRSEWHLNHDGVDIKSILNETKEMQFKRSSWPLTNDTALGVVFIVTTPRDPSVQRITSLLTLS